MAVHGLGGGGHDDGGIEHTRLPGIRQLASNFCPIEVLNEAKHIRTTFQIEITV